MTKPPNKQQWRERERERERGGTKRNRNHQKKRWRIYLRIKTIPFYSSPGQVLYEGAAELGENGGLRRTLNEMTSLQPECVVNGFHAALLATGGFQALEGVRPVSAGEMSAVCKPPFEPPPRVEPPPPP